MQHPVMKQLKRLRRVGPGWLPWNRQRQLLLEMRELRYERLLGNALNGMGIASRYYPIKSAANYSLLYLIMRVATELPVRRVLELGCGQSTLLLDDLSRQHSFDVITLEQDAGWAQRIQAQVAHRIHVAPLVKKTIQGREVDSYAPAPSSLADRVDFLIIDGPVGKLHYSRWGALEYIEALLCEDIVLLFDDVERAGEQDTIQATLELLNERGLDYSVTLTRAIKSQCLIAIGKMKPACYF
jgi:predicted O-methyltransferase YrrM